jgi:glycosyltransferase involved in cell wall biosynthesis
LSSQVTELAIYIVYVLLGPATWVGFGYILWAGRERMKLVRRPPPALTRTPPRVTILIPAKDEGERIRDCILSALNQDYSDFSVIAINDRSTDCTGAVMDELAAQHPGLRVVHIQNDALPHGWTGKCNALHTAVHDADGEWLLFVDSDVVLAPDALSATVSRCVRHGYDLLSLLPKLESHSFWESLLVPLGGTAVSAMYLVALTNKDYLPQTAFANGQYLFIRRSVYDAVGGHATVHDRFCEDVEMARIVKKAGHKTRISWGAEFAAVRMYSSLSGIFKGWGRNFFAGSVGRPWRILLAIFFVIFCCLSVYPALGWSFYRLFQPGEWGLWQAAGWFAASLTHFGLLTGFLAAMYRWVGNPGTNALYFPLGGIMLLAIFCKSLRMCMTGRVEWRGTRYTHRMAPTT